VYGKGGFRLGGRYDETNVIPSRIADLESQAKQALVNTQNQGIPLNAGLVDNTVLGSFWVRAGVSIPTGGVSLAHQLGRKPSGIIVMNDQTGATIYQNGTDLENSDGSLVYLRTRFGDTVGTILIG